MAEWAEWADNLEKKSKCQSKQVPAETFVDFRVYLQLVTSYGMLWLTSNHLRRRNQKHANKQVGLARALWAAIAGSHGPNQFERTETNKDAL